MRALFAALLIALALCPGQPRAEFMMPGSHALPRNVPRLTRQDQVLRGGANVQSQCALGLGTASCTISSGTLTVDCGIVPLQFITNGGAFTLAAPANDGSCTVQSTNNGSAGAITFSGFTVGASTGSALDTTNGHKFSISIWRVNGLAGYSVFAHQ